MSCEEVSGAVLLEKAFRSASAVMVTYILAGEVDTDFEGGSLLCKISWLVRYFNPVNLYWRYYSMLAFRFTSRSWGDTQIALINYEAFPYRPPIPYLTGEHLAPIIIRRLEGSGLFSSQGLLSFIVAYQGIWAIQSVISRHMFGFLPNVSKPLAILGLFRVMVSNWVASKIFVERYPYPQPDPQHIIDYRTNKLIAFSWVAAWLWIALLSFWPWIRYPSNGLNYLMDILYQYNAISVLLYHIALLMHGPLALANRILYFDHWLYKLQTLCLVLLAICTLCLCVGEFVANDFYRFCMREPR